MAALSKPSNCPSGIVGWEADWQVLEAALRLTTSVLNRSRIVQILESMVITPASVAVLRWFQGDQEVAEQSKEQHHEDRHDHR